MPTDPTPAASRGTAVVGRRIGAAVVDMILFVAAGVGLFFAFAPTASATGECARDLGSDTGAAACFVWDGTAYQLDGGRAFAYLSLVGVLWLLYHGLYQALTPTTGKRLFRVDVVDGTGARAPVGRTLVRSLPLAVAALLSVPGLAFAALVGFVTVLVHPRHRRVGDLIARTYVVGRESVGTAVDTSTRH